MIEEDEMSRFCTIGIVASTAILSAQSEQRRMIEWHYIGADQFHTKYSSATDITRTNVDQLKIV